MKKSDMKFSVDVQTVIKETASDLVKSKIYLKKDSIHQKLEDYRSVARKLPTPWGVLLLEHKILLPKQSEQLALH